MGGHPPILVLRQQTAARPACFNPAANDVASRRALFDIARVPGGAEPRDLNGLSAIPTFYHSGFAAPIGTHIMPMEKFTLVAGEVAKWAGIRITEPPPAELADLHRVHTADYVEAIRTGTPRELAESQKFPWSPALYPSVCLTNGGVIAAATAALDRGVACAIASGFHHAHADHGEGFCTFNGLVIALERLRAEGRIQTAAILDLDLHYGNGTAALASTRPWIRALSLYGNDYLENRAYADVTSLRHRDGENHTSIPLPAGSGREVLFERLQSGLAWLLDQGRPDLLLYQAGADPFREDPYSPLDLGMEDLQERDRRVFAFARTHTLPCAWVLAGGYTRDVRKVVEIHVNTFHAARHVYGD